MLQHWLRHVGDDRETSAARRGADRRDRRKDAARGSRHQRIRPAHGRPYHPQTQGKCERLHGSAVRELIDFNARRDRLEHYDADAERWRGVYNALRPHEALGDQPPVTRWRPSPRRRPAALPEPHYEPGEPVRRIGSCGEVSFNGYRILVGRGLAGDHVRVEEHDREVRVYYCWKQVRSVSCDRLVRGRML